MEKRRCHNVDPLCRSGLAATALFSGVEKSSLAATIPVADAPGVAQSIESSPVQLSPVQN